MRSPFRCTRPLAGLLCLLSFPLQAEPLSLQAAIDRTLSHHPSLGAEAAALQATERQARLDALGPAPTLGAELENVAGTGSLSGVHSAEATLRLGRVFELGGKRAARESRGRAETARQANVLRQKRLDLATLATTRYIALAEAQAEVALAQRQIELARESEAAVRHRVERGVAPEGDASIARIAVVRAELEREHAGHEREAARFALAALWGETAAPPLEATGALLELPALPDHDALAARIAATPEQQAFALEAERLEADRVVARAQARPDLSVSLGVRRLEALDDQGLVLSFALPLGTAHRSSYLVSKLDADLEAVAARRDAASLDARQRLFGQWQELKHARTEYESLSERMIPAAADALDATRRGYDEARYSAVQLLQVQTTLLELEQQRLAAAARYHRLLAEIERATAFVGENP